MQLQARFVTVDTEPVAYFARENLAQQPASYAVGLLTAEGKLDLYPSLPIFRLQARVKGVSDELNTPKGPVLWCAACVCLHCAGVVVGAAQVAC